MCAAAGASRAGVSICVPAHNEGPRIGRLLTRLAELPASLCTEVLVCANGCSDDTEQQVTCFAEEDPRVVLLRSPPGKIRAWNHLVRRCATPVAVFMDADVSPQRGSVERLVEALDRPGAIAASGVPLPAAGPELRERLLGLLELSLGYDYLYGGLYALRLAPLTAVMQRHGLGGEDGAPSLPDEIIADDLILDCLLGAEELVVCPEAVAWIDVRNLDDMVRSRARLAVARAQLRSCVPAVYHSRPGRPALDGERLRLLWHRLARKQPVGRGQMLAGTALRRLALVLLRRRYADYQRAMGEEVSRGHGGQVLSGTGRVVSKAAGGRT